MHRMAGQFTFTGKPVRLMRGTSVTVSPFSGNSTATGNHNLGGYPDLVTHYLVPLSATNAEGYATTERIDVSTADSGNAVRCYTVSWDSSGINVYTDTTLQVHKKSTGVITQVANATDWSIVVNSFRYVDE